MALLTEIYDRWFVDKSLFVVVFTGNLPARQTFTEFGPLEGESAEKKHKESGSPISWTGAGTISFANITMKRGVMLSDRPDNQGVHDSHLEDWWELVANSTGNPSPSLDYKRSASLIEFGRNGEPYGYARQIEDMVPRRYKCFEGDANSDEVQIEEMEVTVSRWFRIVGSTYEYGQGEVFPSAPALQ